MGRDADIFADPGKRASPRGDADIFQDVKPETPAAPPAPKAPSTMDRMMQANKYLGIGVPGGVATTMAVEGMGALNQVLERAGYAAGGAVTDAVQSQSGRHTLLNPAAVNISPEAAAGLGYTANVATQALPMIFGGEKAKLAAPAFQSMGRGVMQSAVRPSYETLRTGKASQAIETMLKEGVGVSEGGLNKLLTQVNKLDDEVSSAISTSTATVSKGDVGLRLKEVFDKFKNQVNPQSDLEAIKKAWTEFRDHPLLAGKQDIPVQMAQTMKQGTYKSLGDKPYGELQGASVEAQKALARGLKETISSAVPSVAPMNARQSELLNAANVLERRVLMDPNKALLGLTPLGVNPASWALFMLDRMPGAKSLLARGLYSGAEQIPATAARTGIGYMMMPPENERGALYAPFQ